MSDHDDLDLDPNEAGDNVPESRARGAERNLGLDDGLMLAVASLAVLCSLGLFALGY